jgi:hypothetical protein
MEPSLLDYYLEGIFDLRVCAFLPLKGIANQTWCYIPVIPAFRWLRQEDFMSESWGYRVRLCLKKKIKANLKKVLPNYLSLISVSHGL